MQEVGKEQRKEKREKVTEKGGKGKGENEKGHKEVW